MEWRWFDNLIMLFIILNSIGMANYDYLDDDALKNQILDAIFNVFSLIFTLEAVIKIIALGFVFGKNTYLRDPWNVIDFFIVVTGLLDFFQGFLTGGVISLKSLRVLRILRPLKGIKTVPSLRKQVAALLRSVMGLVNVSVFLLFIFILFGIMGLQWFSGSIYYACRTTAEPLPGAKVWERSPLATAATCVKEVTFGNDFFAPVSGYICPEGTYCGSPLEYGLAVEDDGILWNVDL